MSLVGIFDGKCSSQSISFNLGNKEHLRTPKVPALVKYLIFDHIDRQSDWKLFQCLAYYKDKPIAHWGPKAHAWRGHMVILLGYVQPLLQLRLISRKICMKHIRVFSEIVTCGNVEHRLWRQQFWHSDCRKYRQHNIRDWRYAGLSYRVMGSSTN